MWTVLAVMLALTGLGAAQPAAAPPARSIDASGILYSMATISDELPAMEPASGAVPSSDLLLHEDEWRQIEFFPASRQAEVQRMLTAIKRSSDANRVGEGWQDIHVRRLPAGIVLGGAGALQSLAREVAATAGPAPLIHLGDASMGRVTGGFTIPLGTGVMLYGFRNEAGVLVLAANIGEGADRLSLTTAFRRLNARHRLILVDWRAQMLLLRAVDDNNIEVWEPN